MDNQTESNHKSKKIWIILSLIILLIGLGTLYYLKIYKPSKNKNLNNINKVQDNTKWVEQKDPHGFSVQTPDNWKIKVDETGLVRIGTNPEEKTGPVVFAQTMVFPENKTNAQALESITPELKATFPNFQIISQRTIDEFGSIICQIQYTGSEHIGVLLISTDNKNAFISGLASEKSEYNSNLDNSLKVLSTFKYDNSLKDTSKISGTIDMVSWKDPKEGAFTVDVPKGWDTSGGIVRPYIDAWVKVVSTSGDKGIDVENMYPPLYTAPNAVLQMSGFTEGSKYNPGGAGNEAMIVSSEKNADDYIKNVLASKLGLNVDSTKSRDDIASQIPKWPGTSATTAAEGILFGDGKQHKIILVEQSMSVSTIKIWGVFLVHYWAPASEISLMDDIFADMNKTFKVDSTWAKNEQTQVAKRSQIISQTGSEISDIISSTFEYQSSVQDKTSREFSDALLGIDRIYNPDTRVEYTVPTGSKYYWGNGYDTIIGTETSQNPVPLGNFTELKFVNSAQ